MTGQGPIQVPSLEELLEALNETSDQMTVVSELTFIHGSMTRALAGAEEQIEQAAQPMSARVLEERRQQEEALRAKEAEISDLIEDIAAPMKTRGRSQVQIDSATHDLRRELEEVQAQLRALSGAPEENLQTAVNRRDEIQRSLNELDRLIVIAVCYAVRTATTSGLSDLTDKVNAILESVSDVPTNLVELRTLVPAVQGLQATLQADLEELKTKTGAAPPINLDAVVNRLETPLMRLDTVARELENRFYDLQDRRAAPVPDESVASTNITGIFKMVRALVRNSGLTKRGSDLGMFAGCILFGAIFFGASFAGQYSIALGAALWLVVTYVSFKLLEITRRLIKPDDYQINDPDLVLADVEPETQEQENLTQAQPQRATNWVPADQFDHGIRPRPAVRPRPAGDVATGGDKDIPALDERDIPPFTRPRKP